MTSKALSGENIVTRPPWWLSQPSSAFLRDRHFYTKYDLTWALLVSSVSAILWFGLGWRGFDVGFNMASAPTILGFLAIASFLQVMAGVFVHNGSHQNFPRPINRIVSELMGYVVCTRFASWEILHRFHHLHSDDVKLDPHPVNRGFWRFFFVKMMQGLEHNLTYQYTKRWGDTPEVVARDKRRTLISLLTGILVIASWGVLLGPALFFLGFLPALVFGMVHVSHFNWVTHNAAEEGEEDFRPINLDSGIYWLGNRLLFGLYMHANHHAYLKLFNPLKLSPEKAAKVPQKIRSHRERRGLPA